MAWHGFTRTILFGALAAAGWPLMSALSSWLWSPADALSVYLVGLAAVYVAGLGSSPRRAFGAGLVSILLGALVLVVAPGVVSVAGGAALILGVGRFRLLTMGRPARSFALECAVLSGGLLLAQAVAAPDPLHIGLAIWAFFLAQSLYFLAPELRRREAPAAELDPFDLASHRIDELLRRAGQPPGEYGAS